MIAVFPQLYVFLYTGPTGQLLMQLTLSADFILYCVLHHCSWMAKYNR